MRADDIRHKKLISGLVEEDDSVSPKHEAASNTVAAAVGRAYCVSVQSVFLPQHGIPTKNPCRISAQILPHEGSHQTIPEALDLAPSLPCSQDGRMAVSVAR